MACNKRPNGLYRKTLDGDNIKWRPGIKPGVKPDYSKVDSLYKAERKHCHKDGSLEKIVEDLVKDFEVESSYKINPEDWKTIERENFRLSVNGGPMFTVKNNIEMGNLSILMYDSPLYDPSMDDQTSRLRFQRAFDKGFAWELLEVQSGKLSPVLVKEVFRGFSPLPVGQPGSSVITFTWRHWGKFEKEYHRTCPTHEKIEVYGSCTVRVSDNLKIQSVEVYYDPNPMLAKLTGFKRPSGCPFGQK